MDGASRTAASLVTSDVYDTSRTCGFDMALSIVVDAERLVEDRIALAPGRGV
jgi:hypothetical protein